MNEIELAERFETERPRLRGLALRMLGGEGAADDAVQEAWIRLVRTDQSGETIDNLPGWLTTVVSRICLDLLRSRTSRREATWPDDADLVDSAPTPEEEAELVEAVGQAMTVVLDTLSPAERLAYVLKDVFAVPFDEIGAIVDRTPEATRQLASRARRRVRSGNAVPDADLAAQRAVVDAFLAASRDGDFEGLIAVLDPDVVLHADTGPEPREVRGAAAVAARAKSFSQIGLVIRPPLVNGVLGAVSTLDGELFSIGAATVRGGRIVRLDFIADPERLRHVDVTMLDR